MRGSVSEKSRRSISNKKKDLVINCVFITLLFKNAFKVQFLFDSVEPISYSSPKIT